MTYGSKNRSHQCTFPALPHLSPFCRFLLFHCWKRPQQPAERLERYLSHFEKFTQYNLEFERSAVDKVRERERIKSVTDGQCRKCWMLVLPNNMLRSTIRKDTNVYAIQYENVLMSTLYNTEIYECLRDTIQSYTCVGCLA